MDWFYLENNKKFGPFAEDDLHSLARQTIIGHETLVWKNGMSGWLSYGEGFQGSAKAALSTAWRMSKGKHLKLLAINIRIWLLAFIFLVPGYFVLYIGEMIGDHALNLAVALTAVAYTFVFIALQAWLFITVACYYDDLKPPAADAS